MGYKEVGRQPFNQGTLLLTQEGVCDTLVLGWLDSLTGEVPELVDFSFASFAHHQHLVFKELLAKGGYGLFLKQLDSMTNINEVVLRTFAFNPSTIFIRLGKSTEKVGHAVGVKNAGKGTYRYFDPNEGTVLIEEDPAGDWMKDLLFGQSFLEGWNEYIVASFV